ncbi:MAG TPA: UDP-N-acetylmuramoyl-L-alanyl-D-glutamate--2,6-diaminopimelate ligase [Acidimicrobiia bacterium]
MRWHDLLAGLDRAGYQVVRAGAPDLEITAITHDSRQAIPGACFACIPGAVTDGHDHASDAVARGAVALLVERPLPLAVAQAEVPSVRAALGPVAAMLFGHPSAAMRVLGVTGTNGKTTTTYLLEMIAGRAGDRAGVVGTVGARVAGEPIASANSGVHTTPEASDLQALLARMRDAGTTAVAMEVSSHALHQHRVDGVQFAAVCFTNLSHEHLDYHGSLDAYFEAKASLFTRARTPAAAVNLDDARGVELAARASRDGIDVWTYAVDGAVESVADIGATDVEFGVRSTRATIVDRRGGTDAVVELPLVGSFNLANALAAAATARAGGYSFDAVVAGLADPLVVPGRMERVDAGQPFAVLVDYAHTPDALARVLAAARPLAEADGRGDGRVVCVFGCGGDRDPAKRPLMGAAVAAGADVAVLTSDNPRSEDPQAIADAVLPGLAGAASVRVQLDRRAAIAEALADAEPGDVVVIAGKGHETGQTFAHERTVPFDDRVVAREELEALGWS